MAENFKAIWRIKNAKIWFETRNDALYSHQFNVETEEMITKWRLKLSTNWEPTEKYISLAIQRDHLEEDGPDSVYLQYELSFLQELSPGEMRTMKKQKRIRRFERKTVSDELNVRAVEILEKEKEAYLKEGVLIVCFEMFFGRGSSLPIKNQCFLQSTIGVKDIIMQGNINIRSQNQTVNFTSTSPDIRLISFNLLKSEEGLKFKMIHIEGNRFNWISSELSFFLKSGEKVSCEAFSMVWHPHIEFNVIMPVEDLVLSPTDQQSPVELKMTYLPGLISESVEYN